MGSVSTVHYGIGGAVGQKDSIVLFTSIFKASEQGDLARITKLLDKGQAVNEGDDDGRTPLSHAAGAGQLEATKLLLSRKADINRQGRKGDTPLYHAAREGKSAMVSFLLESGAEPDRCARKGITPLVAAAARGYTPIVEALAARGANIEHPEKNGKTPLLLAIEQGHVTTVELLLRLGANPEHRSSGGRTPLMLAVLAKDPAMVRQLLERGLEVDARDDDGRTAIQHAALCGGYESAELLAAAGANVTQRTNLERWNLATLARNGNYERLAKRLMELELEHSQRPVPRDMLDAVMSGDLCQVRLYLRKHPEALHAPLSEGGWTPLLAAINRSYFPMAEMLIQAGADVNQPNSAGETPLYQAAALGSVVVVRRLLAAGADPAVTCYGIKVRHVAKRAGHPAVYEVIKRFEQQLAEAEVS